MVVQMGDDGGGLVEVMRFYMVQRAQGSCEGRWVGDDRAEGIGHQLSSSRRVEGGNRSMLFHRFPNRKLSVSLWQLLISM